jgi:hypothetical protein
MNATQKRSLWMHSLSLAFTVAAFLGTAPASRSQDLVRGTITLPIAARLGDTTLAAGKYSYAVESLGDIRSAEALQIGNSRVAVIVTSLSTKDAHVVSLIADALKTETLNSRSSDSIDFGAGMTIRAISLKNAGLKVMFTTNRANHILQASATDSAAVRGDD